MAVDNVGTLLGGAGSDVVAAWRAGAPALAEWTMRHLVNRTDAWLSILAPRKQRPDRIAEIARGELEPGLLRRHYSGGGVSSLIGLPCATEQGASRWTAVHVHPHGEGDAATPGDNFQAALQWYDRLNERRIDCLLESDGVEGSYRLLILFESLVDAPNLAAFTEQLVGDWADMDLFHRPTTLPGDRWGLTEEACHWLRLPGRYPRSGRDVPYSRIWSGAEWLDGERAVAAIVATEPSDVRRIFRRPDVQVVEPTAVAERIEPDPVEPPPATVEVIVEIEPEPEPDAGSEQAITLEYRGAPARTSEAPNPVIEEEPAEEPEKEPDMAETPRAPETLSSPDAQQVVAVIAERTGMREEQIVKRVFDWLNEQDEVIQAVVLGQIPTAIRPDVGRLILESLAA
ncbi:MAG: hypothetical protein CMJ18_12280 [Phycisphaeraceae bacterium]|nr:hypothetical protein [Phycisphaeraceae bacterium]